MIRVFFLWAALNALLISQLPLWTPPEAAPKPAGGSKRVKQRVLAHNGAPLVLHGARDNR